MNNTKTAHTLTKQLSLTKLEKGLHTALKQYYNSTSNGIPLSDLYLFQQARIETGSVKEATHQIINETIKTLEAEQKNYAQLLEMRFLEEETIARIAQRLTVAEGTVYKWQKQALNSLAKLLYQQEMQSRQACQSALAKRFDLPAPVHLIGVEHYLQTLLDLLVVPKAPWLISIEGLGGIGKTSLANAVSREVVLTGSFKDIAWISAKQQGLRPSLNFQSTQRPAIDENTLLSLLLEQLNPEQDMPASPQAKLLSLNAILKNAPYFIVIDNLETALDYQTLLPILYKLANPSRFLLTSRHSLQTYSDIACFSLKELNPEDAYSLLRHEAKMRRIKALETASQTHLESIYDVVGGNPLALKLVVGQLSRLPLPRVLANLKRAQGEKIDTLYNHIYWQAWQSLDAVSQQVLLMMPLAQNGSITQLKAISNLETNVLDEALAHLLEVSLLEMSGDLITPRYRIHQLTKAFLLTEVVKKWQEV